MTARRAALVGWIALSAGCWHRGDARPAPTVVEAHGHQYFDSDGLRVTTLALRGEQPLSPLLSLDAHALLDHIVLTPTPLSTGPLTLENQETGHDVDIVTSASSVVGGGAGSNKWRQEGLVGATLRAQDAQSPRALRATARVSHESDYDSVSALLRGSLELFEHNTTLGAFVGAGHDLISPLEAPPGQERSWPATSRRLTLGFTLSQVLSTRLLLSSGFAFNQQWGQLANPYRRALVRTSLFSEILPDRRGRFTGFAHLAWYLGWDAAAHLQAGAYADTWGVVSLIPECLIAKNVDESFLVELRYRYYGQRAASFYAPQYSELRPLLSGDARLGQLEEHSLGIDALWTILGRRGAFGSLSLTLGYSFADLSYDSLRSARLRSDNLLSHVLDAGAIGAF